MSKLKVNLHITETCNFHCRHCFAKFDGKPSLSLPAWKQILDNLKASGMVSHINFAGGEPLLYPSFKELFAYAYAQHFILSVISNGYFLSDEKYLPNRFFQKLSMLGISVDSLDERTQREVGRCDREGNILTLPVLKEIIRKAKAENPHIAIKLNTVVTVCNKDEKLTEKLSDLPIDRWKILKMKPFRTKKFSNYDLRISGADFAAFWLNNQPHGEKQVLESTLDRSYIFIDPQGNLLDNGGDKYAIVGNLLEEDFASIMKRYALNRDLYEARYKEG